MEHYREWVIGEHYMECVRDGTPLGMCHRDGTIQGTCHRDATLQGTCHKDETGNVS
jgi:hypothetical protein